MIGYLNGEIVASDDPFIVIDVGGVGYSVVASKDVLGKAIINSRLKLFIYTHVREDLIQLYGFLDFSDLKLFRSLISVSGIGPKTAMGIFAVGSRLSIIQAIINADVAFFESAPRLGRKNAQKIIIELKNKFGGAKEEVDLSEKDIKERNEIVSALTGFGFSKKEALDTLKTIKGEGKSVEEKIRLALKEIGK